MEQLREKIAEKFLEYDFDRHGVKYGVLADEVIALIKEALPELAKEAGYVKLTDNQSLPKEPVPWGNKEQFEDFISGYRTGQVDMFEADWRKVKLK